jgi:hypothetical protein
MTNELDDALDLPHVIGDLQLDRADIMCAACDDGVDPASGTT